MKPLQQLVRANIWSLKPYSSARSEFSGEGSVFLDANENPFNSPLNRYPDPLQHSLKQKISPIKQVPEDCIFLGNGSDEAIDLCFRVFCEPAADNVVAIEPTYGMYKVAADINDVEYRPALLSASDFSFNADALLGLCDDNTKLVFLCSPNNPTGNCLERSEVERVLDGFQGIVVVDEAYSDFSRVRPFRLDLAKYPNLVVLNTMSKAWASAGIRLGMAFAQPEIIGLFNKVKYPYNVNALTLREAVRMTERRYDVDSWVRLILDERVRLMSAVSVLPYCTKVFPTDANFFLCRMHNASLVYKYLLERGIIVRNRTNVALCRDCLRITVGSPKENTRILAALRQYKE